MISLNYCEDNNKKSDMVGMGVVRRINTPLYKFDVKEQKTYLLSFDGCQDTLPQPSDNWNELKFK